MHTTINTFKSVIFVLSSEVGQYRRAQWGNLSPVDPDKILPKNVIRLDDCIELGGHPLDILWNSACNAGSNH